jgi:hypothetical protein
MLYVPLVKAECELIDVEAKMLLARVMINTDQAPFKNGENAQRYLWSRRHGRTRLRYG